MRNLVVLLLVTALAFASVLNLSSAGTDELIGKWTTTTTMEEVKSSVVIEFRKEGDGIKGYLIEMKEEGKKAEKLNEVMIDEIESEDDRIAGNYQIEYEGSKYDADCTIVLKNINEFLLEYSLYGYDGKETWTRVK